MMEHALPLFSLNQNNMFTNSNKIIIVDDSETDLLTLSKVFLETGTACKAIEYSEYYNEAPLAGIRLAFFDINLTNRGADFNQEIYNYKEDRNLSSTFNDLSVAINKIISKENGPYVLIFWSLRTKCIENLKEYINDAERGYKDTPMPISIFSLEKEELLHKTPKEISAKISSLLTSNCFQLLYDFESKCMNAATKTINEIYNIIPKNRQTNWGETDLNFENNFKNIFLNIAIFGVGKEMAIKEPDKAIYKTLMPLLEHQLTQLLPEEKWKNILEKLPNPSFPENFNIALLNSIFHIDFETEIQKHYRGAVFEYDIITDDQKKKFGGHLPSYYKVLEKLSNELLSHFISFSEECTMKSEFKFNSKFIVIEISASCDFSNNKKRNLKYVLGLLTPCINGIQGITKASEAVLQREMPTFLINNSKCSLLINLNYTFSGLAVNSNIGKPLFLLKKELVDMIGNRYANHVSRIGITSF